jgi:ATP-dependent RNA helicase DBP3
MSVEIDVKLSKEERRKIKEEKKARKAAASGDAPAEEKTEKKDKKDKKDKKRARDEDGEEKKSKKSKSSDATPTTTGSSTPAETVLATPAEGVTEAPALSKKQLKKLKAAAAAAEAEAATDAAPAVAPRNFTAADKAYLAEQNITLEPALFPPHLDMKTLPVNAKIADFLSAFPKPTPIQSVSWPALLAKRDVVGIAETGSGKTLSFGVPGMNILAGLPPAKKGNPKGKLAMLVLAPTRELAQQSFDTLVKLGSGLGINSVALFGGMPRNDQIFKLRQDGVRIVVGTPGRTLDLADSGDLDLSAIKYLVLDEADRMLDAGFENDIRRIIAHCADHDNGRQTVMCEYC